MTILYFFPEIASKTKTSYLQDAFHFPFCISSIIRKKKKKTTFLNLKSIHVAGEFNKLINWAFSFMRRCHIALV